MLQGKLENCPNHLKLLWLSKRSGGNLSFWIFTNRGNFLHWLLTPVNITISRTCIFILFKYFRSHFKSNLLEWFWVSGWNFLLRPSFTIMHFCPHRSSPSHHSSMFKRKLSFQFFSQIHSHPQINIQYGNLKDHEWRRPYVILK